MKAVEISGKTDEEGHLKIDYPLNLKNEKVRVIILMQENHENEEEIWLRSISSNPALDFLKEEPDIYSLTDGLPLND